MKEILDELRRLYPNAGPELNFSNPYETLVATMLSAQCTDKQVNKVTPEVFRRYPNAVAMAACTRDELYPLVKSCGFKSKAGNIVEACRIITQKYGGEAVFPPPRVTIAWSRYHIASLYDFVSAVAAGRDTHPNFEDGFRVQQLTDAIYRSAETGRIVKL